MDALKLVSAWDRAALAAAPIAVPVSGLLLQVRRKPLRSDIAHRPTCQSVRPQGCSFDAPRSVLVDAVADAPEVLVLPDITLAWVAPDFPEPYAAGTTIPVPVYQVRDALLPCCCSDLSYMHPACFRDAAGSRPRAPRRRIHGARRRGQGALHSCRLRHVSRGELGGPKFKGEPGGFPRSHRER